MHADNSNNCNDYSLFNDGVPSRQSYGSINTVQRGDQDIINMPAKCMILTIMTYCLPLIQIDVSMLGQIAIILTAMNLILNLKRQLDFR